MTEGQLMNSYPSFSRTKTEDPLLELQHVDLDYRQGKGWNHILEDINLQAYNGDFICLLGASGCGKTSILNLVAGYNRPSRGEVRFKGKPLRGPRSEIGVVFQQENLFPWLTVYENVEFGLKEKHIPKNERKDIVEYFLELVGLENAAGRLPYQLSGGMKQRTTIARTLAPDPSVVLFDEPLSALDALTREKLQIHIKSIWKNSHKCFLFITHDVDEALFMGQRIVVMKPRPGRIYRDFTNSLSSIEGINAQTIRETTHYSEKREEIISLIRSDEDMALDRLLKIS